MMRSVNRKTLHLEQCEPRHLLAALADLAPASPADAQFITEGVIHEPGCEIPGTSSETVASETAARSEDNLRALALGILNYESANRRLPAHAIYSVDDVPLLSWRVNILPFLGYGELYQRFHRDEPWDSTHNSGLLKEIPSEFRSPNIVHHPLSTTPQPHGTDTVYQVMVGAGTVFPEDRRGLRFRDIRDGLSNTVFVAETDADRAVPWTSPQDIMFDEANPLDGLGHATEFGFGAVLADATVLDIPTSVDADLWKYIVLRDDGQFVDLNQFAPPLEPDISLRQLAHATLNFDSVTGRLPAPAIYSDEGEALLSWRVAVLPYLEQQALYDAFHLDEPWDSPHNLTLLPMMPRVFAHDLVPAGMTNFLAFVGDDTIFPIPDVGRPGLSVGQVRDGLSKTILFAEADIDFAVEWTKPQDIAFDPLDPLRGVGHATEFGFGAVLADATVLDIPTSVDVDLWTYLVLRNDGQFVDLNQLLPPMPPRNSLRNLSLATLNYESGRGRLPEHAIYSDSGEALLSWRVAILPYLDSGAILYDQFHLDEPWDSPHNLTLLPMMPRVFAHDLVPIGMTNYLAFVGDDTAFPEGSQGIENFPDGRSNTILFAEADPEFAVEWTKPQDIAFDPLDPLQGVGHVGPTEFHIVFADGHATALPNTTSATDFAQFVIRNDSQSLRLQREVPSPTDRRTRSVLPALPPNSHLPGVRQNVDLPLDVDDNGVVSPMDALLVINALPLLGQPPNSEFYYDVNADAAISPLDALIVINELNSASSLRPADNPADRSDVATTAVQPVLSGTRTLHDQVIAAWPYMTYLEDADTDEEALNESWQFLQ